MTAHWLVVSSVVVSTVASMEFVAAALHRHVMHGFGWGWHQSHHVRRQGLLEANDLYAVVFAALSVVLFVAASWYPLLWWVGLGMVIYGSLYALLHDVLVHRRLHFLRSPPKNAYLKRLVQAHRLHHAVRERNGAVSFGFLYAPPIHSLVRRLRAAKTDQ